MNVYLCSNHYSQWPFSIFTFNFIFNHYAQHADILQCRLTNAVTNKKKKQIWNDIATEVNARGTDRRIVAKLKKNGQKYDPVCAFYTNDKIQKQKMPEPWLLTYVLDVLGVNTVFVD